MKRNGNIILLIAVLLGAGCAQPTSKEGLGQLALARRQFEEKNYIRAEQQLCGFLQRESNSPNAGEAFYLRGLCYQHLGSVQDGRAEADFLQAVKKGGPDNVTALARVALGHIYFETRPNEAQKTIQFYEQALRALPEEPPKDAVLYRLAVTLQMADRWSEADVYLSRCFDSFGASEFAPYARDRFGSRCWRLQYDAFGDMKRATDLITRLKENGLSADWTPRRKEGRLLYAVRSGRYRTYAQAQKALPFARSVQSGVEIVPAP